ncbi:MAG: antibiotic biosynthesis monooxygenase [Actinobacteria bacterium]|nr:antibiotic biosynthesis monooxygenase [Actinomycetota bacterium]
MYAVIFRSIRTNAHEELYQSQAKNMEALVKSIPGYISHFSYRDPASRSGVTIAYFESLEAIKAWRENPEHLEAQELGRGLFYSWYEIQVVKLERGYEWSLGE